MRNKNGIDEKQSHGDYVNQREISVYVEKREKWLGGKRVAESDLGLNKN